MLKALLTMSSGIHLSNLLHDGLLMVPTRRVQAKREAGEAAALKAKDEEVKITVQERDQLREKLKHLQNQILRGTGPAHLVSCREAHYDISASTILVELLARMAGSAKACQRSRLPSLGCCYLTAWGVQLVSKYRGVHHLACSQPANNLSSAIARRLSVVLQVLAWLGHCHQRG